MPFSASIVRHGGESQAAMNDDRNERVVAEFTRQSHSYAKTPELNDEKALEVLSSVAGVCESDIVLDVACGPGVVACYVARLACHVTGIDLTPAMIEKARELQSRQGITNVDEGRRVRLLEDVPMTL